jgi:hypothetical protein
MEEFKIVYFEGDSDTSVGCVARQCPRSKSDVLKRIGRPGKKIHSHCPTVRGDGIVKMQQQRIVLKKYQKSLRNNEWQNKWKLWKQTKSGFVSCSRSILLDCWSIGLLNCTNIFSDCFLNS